MRDNLRQIAAAAKMVLPQAGRKFVPTTKITPPLTLASSSARRQRAAPFFLFILLYYTIYSHVRRLSRIIGHLQKVKDMVENDEDCADILVQLSAVNSAVRSLGKVIINEHITHCLIHAMEDGDSHSIEDFQKAIERFL